jgi:hypothetical protein
MHLADQTDISVGGGTCVRVCHLQFRIDWEGREMRLPFAVILAGSLSGLAPFVANAQAGRAPEFVPEDIEVCPVAAQVRDPEFDEFSSKMVYTDRQQRLKLVSVRGDGTMMPHTCRSAVIDSGLTLGLPSLPARNGAEWGRSQLGLEMYYTKLTPEGLPALAHAWKPPGSDSWQLGFLPNGTNRGLAIASTDDADPQPRLIYARDNGDGTYSALWREANDPVNEYSVPWSYAEGMLGAPRWISSQRAFTTVVQTPDGTHQAARYFIDSATVEFLTTNAGQKDEVWMWSAPEYGGDLIFSTVVDRCCLEIYRQVAGAWVLISRFTISDYSVQPNIFSPQPFVYRHRSYLSFTASTDRQSNVSELWLLAVDPANPLVRRLDDPTLPNQDRREPEPFTTKAGAFVYYTQTSPEGYTLRRVQTGL